MTDLLDFIYHRFIITHHSQGREIMNKRIRDTQRSKVYEAERHWRIAIGAEGTFPTKLAFWAYVEKIEKDAWFRRTYPHVGRVKIHDGRGRRSAAAWHGIGSNITVPQFARRPSTVLHEMAHLAARCEHRHGWQYAATMLALVKHFLGVEAYKVLRAHYATFRVRYKQPRTRVMTEAQKQALRDRLAVHRLLKSLKAASGPQDG